MKRFTAAVIVGVLVITGGTAAAHQPRLVGDGRLVEVRKPEVSQAFYAELAGEPHRYRVASESPFNLYVNLLTPALPGNRDDFKAEVFRADPVGEQDRLLVLEGARHQWEPFFEPFVGDRYYRGPEEDLPVPAGTYLVQVSNPDNRGKYVLSIGRKEAFTAGEAVATVRRLPAVKAYFGKSPWTALLNLTGLFLVLSVLLPVAAGYGIWRVVLLLRRHRA